MATSTITIVDLDEGGVSVEVEHDAAPEPNGTWSPAQQIAIALHDRLAALGVEFDTSGTTDGATCTCPSGDGSLRHPCAVHPIAPQEAG